MKISTPRHRRGWHVAIVLAAAVLPMLLAYPLVMREAERRAESEVTLTATLVLRQLDRIFSSTDRTIRDTAELLGRPCDDGVNRSLRELSTLRPYFRALLLIQDDRIYCSSLLGNIDLPISVYKDLHSLPPGRAITPTDRTPFVTDRGAVLVTLNQGGQSGVLAVIDERYLQDIQVAAEAESHFDIDMQLVDGRALLATSKRHPTAPGRNAHQSSNGTLETVRSQQFPFEVSNRLMPAYAARDISGIWRDTLPIIALAGLFAAYLAHLVCSRQLSLTGEITRAMRRHQFHMVYQPVISLDSGTLGGVEALIRWQHPSAGPMRPDFFIPIAEENGQIADLTRHIFGLVARDLPTLGLRPGDHLGINVSGSHVASPEFVGDVQRLIRQMGPDAPILTLEVTEREALPDQDHVHHNMALLRRQGVQWALDDFGTGQSSLAYLEWLKADFIKIDRSFVRGIGTGSVTSVVLDTLIALAQRLNLALIAEGIETEGQADFLRQANVAYGQGFLYSCLLYTSPSPRD